MTPDALRVSYPVFSRISAGREVYWMDVKDKREVLFVGVAGNVFTTVVEGADLVVFASTRNAANQVFSDADGIALAYYSSI